LVNRVLGEYSVKGEVIYFEKLEKKTRFKEQKLHSSILKFTLPPFRKSVISNKPEKLSRGR